MRRLRSRSMWRYATIFAVFLAVVPSMPTTAQDLDRAETVTFVGHSAWAPFHFAHDQEDPAGFAVDLVHLLSDELDWKPQIEIYDDWHQAQQDVLNGAADVIMGIIVDNARKDLGFVFSRSILTSRAMIFVREDTVDVQELDDLAGSVVAATAGSPFDTYFSKRSDVSLEAVSQLEEGLDFLVAGRVRALVGGDLPIRYLVQSLQLEGIKAVGEPIQSLPFAMAAGPANSDMIDAIDEGLARLEESGKLDDLRTKWFGAPLGVVQTPDWVLPLIVGIVCVALLATGAFAVVAVFNRRLRDAVGHATGALRESNRLLRTLSDCNQALVKNTTESGLVDELCNVLVNEAGYPAAWVGLQDNTGELVATIWCRTAPGSAGTEASSRTFDRGFRTKLNNIDSCCSRLEHRGRLCDIEPAVLRSLEGRFDCRLPANVLDRVAHDATAADRPCAVLPLIDRHEEGTAIGVFGVCSRKPHGFTQEESAILNELAGDVSYGISSIRNSRRLVQNEHELSRRTRFVETLIETAPLAIFTLDTRGTVKSWNTAAERIYGRTKDEVIDRKLRAFPENRTAEFTELIERVSAENELSGVELDQVKKDGTTITVSLSAALVRAQQEPDQLILVIAEDVTGRRQQEIEEAKRLDQVRTAQKMEALGTLAGGIAHDFNNILTAVYGHAEIASLAQETGGELSDHLREITRGAERATELVRQILKFSRQTENERVPIRLSPIVKESVKLLEVSAPANVNIQGNWNARTGVVLADTTQMHQVIMNLCTNAFHAVGESGGTVTIGLNDVELKPDNPLLLTNGSLAPGPYVELSISDTGHGIPARDIERIFEPYFTTKPIGKGTGLGLSVVHGIVRSHGGDITVESEVGVGTTFRCYFRRVDDSDENSETAPPPIRGNGQRVLFVDDEASIVDLIDRGLSKLGYTIVSTTSPSRALTLFEKDPDAFDIIITDYSMPDTTGTELGRRFLQIREDVPIVICTGYSEYLTADSIAQMGFRLLVMKPLLVSELTHRIVEVLGDEP